MEEKLSLLKEKLLEIDDIRSATAVLYWDQATYMPPGGGASRGRHMATLQRIAHEKAISPELGELIENLEAETGDLLDDSDDKALVRLARRDYDQLTKVPPKRLEAFVIHRAQSFEAWKRARPENDFQAVEPFLEKSLDFSREYANYFPGYDHIADPLIDMSDYGMKAESVRSVFDALRERLVPLVQEITDQVPADDSCLHQHFPEEQQAAFGLEIIKQYGFDFERGRQDKTHHPFMTRFSSGDIRITTRFNERDLSDGLFSTLHEAGHAMYEMGINPKFNGLPLGGGTSSGVHESQSRLWENVVGRSRNFWEWKYPALQEQFPEQFGNVTLDTFYRAINKVSRSLIRVDADEVTYNLHVMLRFELELQLLEGSLSVKDLPDAWREAMAGMLGAVPEDDRDGVMQDVHWYDGTIGGAFQGYTLGNIMSAQFYEAALKDQPAIPEEIGRGSFETLRNWMAENIYQYGSKYTANELLERTTGQGLDVGPLMRYLEGKYRPLYGI